MKIETRFVDFIPDVLEENVLYISMIYGTVLHKCACGCGKEVSTPLAPSEWSLKYNGNEISLYPSIGNWSFPCQSHYWIKGSEIVWAKTWDLDTIKESRELEYEERNSFFTNRSNTSSAYVSSKKAKRKWYSKFLFWL